MSRTIKEYLGGDTIQITWVNTAGAAPSDLFAAIYSSSGTLVNSVTMTDSGANMWYSNVTLPTTPGSYVAETQAAISSQTYKRRLRFRVVPEDV